MPITVVVGGQFGGEGKGKVVAHLSRNRGYDAVVRCGGPNSGHTITLDNKQIVLRQIPAGIVNEEIQLFLSAGCLIDLDVLTKEIEYFSLTPDRLKIDCNAVIIAEDYVKKEKEAKLDKQLGSTCTGTGIAVSKRTMRGKDVKLAKHISSLRPFISNVSKDVMFLHTLGEKIIIEGTQGFGLSVYHTPFYPYATSRDTTASGFLSEVGVSPFVVSDVILVLRTFPIRVGGNSGPLFQEIDWKTLQSESGYPYEHKEYTTVTKKLRRVGRFDINIVKQATIANLPTQIALMGVDYLNYKNTEAISFGNLMDETKSFVTWLEQQLKTKITIIGTGPKDHEIIDILKGYQNDQKRKGERVFRNISRC